MGVRHFGSLEALNKMRRTGSVVKPLSTGQYQRHLSCMREGRHLLIPRAVRLLKGFKMNLGWGELTKPELKPICVSSPRCLYRVTRDYEILFCLDISPNASLHLLQLLIYGVIDYPYRRSAHQEYRRLMSGTGHRGCHMRRKICGKRDTSLGLILNRQQVLH